MLSRRALVGRLTAGAAAAYAVSFARISSAAVNVDQKSEAAPEPHPAPMAANTEVIDSGPAATLTAPAPWELLHPLTAGSDLANGWSVADLTGVVDGSCVVTLQNARGRSLRVHV